MSIKGQGKDVELTIIRVMGERCTLSAIVPVRYALLSQHMPSELVLNCATWFQLGFGIYTPLP